MNKLITKILFSILTFSLTPEVISIEKCEKYWFYAFGSCYYASNYVLNWKTAKIACKQADSSLFIINSKQELVDVMSVISPRSGIYYWVGIRQKII